MKKPKKKDHIKQAAFAHYNISSLEDHKRTGGKLSPPLADIANTSLISWRDHGLNEMLWAAILRGNIDQQKCLSLFRRIVVKAKEEDPQYKDTFISHSALAAISDEKFDALMAPLFGDEQANNLLRSLIYMDCLPDRHHWLRHLKEPESQSHYEYLMKGVASCLDHQSQESTDIRWLKVMYCAIIQGRLMFPEKMDDMVEGLRLYPDYGDQRSVRPRIRALEISLRSTLENKGHPYEIPESLCKNVAPSWSEKFWRECLKKSACLTGDFHKPDHTENDWYFDQFFDVYRKVAEHFIANNEDSDIDAMRDSLYGLVLYSIFIGLTIGRSGFHRRAEGRMLLRTLVETFITLKYLTYKNNSTIWQQFRSYGTGQAKLAFLKNLRHETLPSFVNLNDLQLYANEDLWQEYSNISIKPWSEKNLRKMSEECGVKDFYDKYYDWASGYIHGNWGAIRDTVFTVCLNPLHRYHRIPLFPKLDMPSVQPDAAKILNSMLDILGHFYPVFKERIKHPK